MRRRSWAVYPAMSGGEVRVVGGRWRRFSSGDGDRDCDCGGWLERGWRRKFRKGGEEEEVEELRREELVVVFAG